VLDCGHREVDRQTACESQPFSEISQLIWIKRFGEAGKILLVSFRRHAGKKVLRSGEQVIPSTL